jgi:hypothetical protein
MGRPRKEETQIRAYWRELKRREKERNNKKVLEREATKQ